VLALLLFNHYTKDLPGTNRRKFIYADDLALACQSKDFERLENFLNLIYYTNTINNGGSNLTYQKRKLLSSA